MKNELKLYVALPLFILATCIMWGMSLSLIYIFIIAFDASNYEWWIALILLYGMSIALPIIIYPRTMTKIYLNELGIKKVLLKKSKGKFVKWEDVKDVQVLTRPNGYSYIVISNSPIKCNSFDELIKDKNIIYFTYNDKAMQYINDKINK